MSSNREAVWRIGGASITGSAHLRTQRPNQDAAAWIPRAGAGPTIVGAVSDGHGAPAHFRSGTGAELAVEAATQLLARHMESRDADEELAAQMLARWRAAVDLHRTANPLNDAETIAAPASPYHPYGATLIAFAATRDQLVALQIGDGDLFLGFPGGRITRPLGSDEGLVGEQTFSLCLPDAAPRFRVVSMWREDGLAWPDFALLASDGVTKSFSDEAALEDTIAQFRRLALRSWDELSTGLPAWLDQLSAHGSGDDSTLCVAAREPDPAS